MFDSVQQPQAEFGSYRMIRLLGSGGMGSVWLAEHLHLKRAVALKLMDREQSTNSEFRERFTRESCTVAALDQPHIIPVYDAGDVDGALYIAMRYVSGGDLHKVLTRGPDLSYARVVTIIEQVASALDAAHDARLIHRDIKPANILMSVGPNGLDHCYLSDFGASKRIDTASSLTKTGHIIGTVAYMAPERVQSPTSDSRADIYALAALTYRMLTGKEVFRRDNDLAVLWAQVQDEPQAPTNQKLN